VRSALGLWGMHWAIGVVD